MSPKAIPSVGDLTFQLYTWYRSSSASRLRIALSLKSIPYTSIAVDLHSNSQHDATYASKNPSKTVPTLVITNPQDQFSITITQSVPAMEYLDEAFPDTYPLLPKDPAKRAVVRTLVQIIVSDIQPPTSLRTLKKVGELGGKDAVGVWAKEVIHREFLAYEKVCERSAGKYSVGDEVTMADCCLVPAIWSAMFFGVDFESGEFPTVWRVFKVLEEREDVLRAHWRRQGDTPVELRE